MSSRNVYLNSEERKNALSLIKSLEMAEEIIEAGEREVDQVTDIMKKMIESHPGCQVDYIEILDFENMEEIKEIKGKVLIALAVRLGKTRLIDNKILEVE
jgi:pantoate--beta-alanine ligase